MRLTYLDQYHFYNASIMPESPVVVKVGVDGLLDLVKAREHYPTACIAGYEADKKNYDAMAPFAGGTIDNFHQCAVGPLGEMVLHRFTNSVSNSEFPRHTYDKNCKLVEKYSVPSRTIGEVIAFAGGRIDLLILNCEGGELHIMRDMRDSELRNAIGQICVSWHDPRIYPTAKRSSIVDAIGAYYHIIKGECPRGGIPDQLWIRKVNANG